VRYLGALEDPERTTQMYEWRGVLTYLRTLTGITPQTTWLDYGCGVGGFVQYLRSHGVPRAAGFEQGWGEARLEERGIPHVRNEDLEGHEGLYDVITAVEVLEHAIDPINELKRMRSLLKPGGVLFLTTGNASPYHNRLSKWRYIMPEVHISLFEPKTLALAFEMTDFEARFPGFGPGWVDIYRAKALRTIGVYKINLMSKFLPWTMLARAFEAKLRLAEHPVGIAAGQ
jgi:SAM-dependent methyltransferase